MVYSNLFIPFHLNSGKGLLVKKFLAKQQIQIWKCLPVDCLQNNDLPCMNFAVTISSINFCFVCDLLASLSHSSLMAEQLAPKRNLCPNSRMTLRRSCRIQKLFPSRAFLSRSLVFVALRVHSKKVLIQE